MTAVPDQTDAVRVVDGPGLLAGFPSLFEIRRPIVAPLSYDTPPGTGQDRTSGANHGP
jgi:hypothetical protein